MNALADIMEKRERLLARADAERSSLSQAMTGVRGGLVLADRAVAWARWLKARPYLIAAAAAAIVLIRPKRAFGWSARVLALWRIGRILFDAVKAPGGNRPS
jgi:hypothetical protein